MGHAASVFDCATNPLNSLPEDGDEDSVLLGAATGDPEAGEGAAGAAGASGVAADIFASDRPERCLELFTATTTLTWMRIRVVCRTLHRRSVASVPRKTGARGRL